MRLENFSSSVVYDALLLHIDAFALTLHWLSQQGGDLRLLLVESARACQQLHLFCVVVHHIVIWHMWIMFGMEWYCDIKFGLKK